MEPEDLFKQAEDRRGARICTFNGLPYVALPVGKNYGCLHCDFLPYDSLACNQAPLCSSEFRSDGVDVIWKRKIDIQDLRWVHGKVKNLLTKCQEGDLDV